MKELGNKCILYLLCISLLWIPTDAIQIAVCCLTVGISCLISYFDRWQITACFLAVYSILTIPCPLFALFLPVFVYDAVKNPNVTILQHKNTEAFLFANQYIAKWFINMGILLFAALLSIPQYPPTTIFYLLLFSALACLMQYYSRQIDSLLLTYYNYRDESTQSERYLKEKNAILIQQQDYEISLAMASERNRIARDIHDNVGHMLTRSILQTGAIQVINQNPDLDQPIQELQQTLNTAMTSIRNSVHNLHQDTIDIKHTIEEMIRMIPDRSITLNYQIDTFLPQNIQYAFIAIIREALNNITKHSNADQVSIQIREQPALFQLLIQDNGTDIGEISPTGIGLTGMRERIHSLGGNIHFATKEGFQIFISVMKKS